MPDPHQLLLFLATGWLLNLTPGPDVLYIVTSAVRHGVRSGLVAGLGITAGCCIHVALGAVGLGALLATSAWAFMAVKWLGAGYLLWVGAGMALARRPATTPGLGGRTGTGTRQVFFKGFWTNVLNPKVAVFFLAFLPQFIPAAAAAKGVRFLWLGLLFNASSIVINAGWALAANWLTQRSMIHRRLVWLDRLAGAMFVGFGVRLALTAGPAR